MVDPQRSRGVFLVHRSFDHNLCLYQVIEVRGTDI